MSSDNGNAGFLDRMVKLVSGPGRGTESPNSPAETTVDQFDDGDKAELKAMIERKRRNDFVRKREFDMLRRIRREGLTGDQAHMLEAASSRLDENETRPTSFTNGGSGDTVKAKIDAIEKQMVGHPGSPMPTMAAAPRVPVRTRAPAPAAPREARNTQIPTLPPTLPMHLVPAEGGTAGIKRPGFSATQVPSSPVRPMARPSFQATQLPIQLPPQSAPAPAVARPSPAAAAAPSPIPTAQAARPAMRPPAPAPTPAPVRVPGLAQPLPPRPASAAPSPARPAVAPLRTAPAPIAKPPPEAVRRAPVLSAPAPAPAVNRNLLNTGLAEIEVSEIGHDHELDEAVIAFANADFSYCEQLLTQITSPKGSRHNQADTWLVLFDLYRATGQQLRFDSLTLDYANHFQRSAPQWFSLPQLVIEAAQGDPTRPSANDIGWVCPARLDLEGLAQLSSQLLQLPSPWVLDWRLLMSIDTEAAAKLHSVFNHWASQTVEMCWLNPDRLLSVLQENTPVGSRDVDPAFWLARMSALRLCNRPDQFDEIAIDYCVTYEVSPPSWEPAKGTVRIGDSQLGTQSAPLSVIGDITTTEMMPVGGGNAHSITSLELSGQLSGDIGTVLAMLDSRLGESMFVHISCALLLRVDFIAAGDVLNWVIAKRSEGRHVSFTEVHRLVALMFGAMGITEHAGVKLRQS